MRGDFVLYTLGVAQSLMLHAKPCLPLQDNAGRRVAGRAGPDADAGRRNRPFEGMKLCLGRRHASYRREMATFVQPWAHLIRDIQCDVQIWQGTKDTWTPPQWPARLPLIWRTCDGHILRKGWVTIRPWPPP